MDEATNGNLALSEELKAKQSLIDQQMHALGMSDAQMKERLGLADKERLAETTRLQREVDHLRALQAAALAAGTHKGRQMLYMESLKAPQPRANDPASLEKARTRSHLSWRDGKELEKYAKHMMKSLSGGNRTKEEKKQLENVLVGGGEVGPAPTSLQSTAVDQARTNASIATTASDADAELHLLSRMYAGDYTAEMGGKSYASPGSGGAAHERGKKANLEIFELSYGKGTVKGS